MEVIIFIFKTLCASVSSVVNLFLYFQPAVIDFA